MEQNSSWEANSHLSSHGIPCLPLIPEVYYGLHLVPILSQMHPVHTSPAPYFPKVHSNIILPSTPRYSKWAVPLTFPNQNIVCISHISPIRATCPARLILLYLITVMISGEAYKLWSSSLCSLLQPRSSFLLGTNILLSALFSVTLNLCSSLSVRDQVLHPYKTGQPENSITKVWRTEI